MINKDQAVSPSYCMATPPPPLPSASYSVSLAQSSLGRRSILLTGEGRGGGCGRSQIIRRRESLVLYNSFNTLWCKVFTFLGMKKPNAQLCQTWQIFLRSFFKETCFLYLYVQRYALSSNTQKKYTLSNYVMFLFCQRTSNVTLLSKGVLCEHFKVIVFLQRFVQLNRPFLSVY